MIAASKKANPDGKPMWYRTIYFVSDQPIDQIATNSKNLTFANEGKLDGTWYGADSGVIRYDPQSKIISLSKKASILVIGADVGDGSDNIEIFGLAVPDAAKEPQPEVKLRLPSVKKTPTIAQPYSSERPHPIEAWFTQDVWNRLFPKANLRCYANLAPYSHAGFINAIRFFPGFASGDLMQQKKEVAAFFGISLQETGGKPLAAADDPKRPAEVVPFRLPGLSKTTTAAAQGWWVPPGDEPDLPSHHYGLIVSSETGGELIPAYRSLPYGNQGFFDWQGKKEPLTPEQTGYWGSGMKQLTYAENFARFSLDCFADYTYLLDYPDLVRTDELLVFLSAVYYWMSAADKRPSCHCCFTGQPASEADIAAFARITNKGYQQGLAMAICAVNGIECAIPADNRVATRTNGYLEYGKEFGLTLEQLLQDCSLETQDQPPNLNEV
jgi:hypothetical protein